MEIKSAAYIISNPSVDKCPKPDRPEFAFIGRSNVGKSSLINMLCKNSKLAKTSGTPGKTQLINHYKIESLDEKARLKKNWYLVDLPGYGYAKISQSQRKQWQKMIQDYLTTRESLTCVFVLIDARIDPQKVDLEFIDQLGEWNVPFVLVFTKTEKEKPMALERNIKAFLDAMRETWQFLPQHFVTSAVTGKGRKEVLDFISESMSTPA